MGRWKARVLVSVSYADEPSGYNNKNRDGGRSPSPKKNRLVGTLPVDLAGYSRWTTPAMMSRRNGSARLAVAIIRSRLHGSSVSGRPISVIIDIPSTRVP